MGNQQGTKTDEAKVCLTDQQMKNILDADRGVSGACQTAKEWIEGFYPQENKVNGFFNSIFQAGKTRAQKKVARKVKVKATYRVSKMIDDFFRDIF